jgi:hypothetical protein
MNAARLLIALAGGCSRIEEAGAEAVLEQSHQVTFQTVLQLGPHRLESTTTTELLESGESESDSTEFAWADSENFMVRQIRDGEVRQEFRVLQNTPYVRSGERFDERDDAELYRGILAQTWDTWGAALEPFSEHVRYEYDAPVVVEGRRAHRYILRLPTDEEKQEAGRAEAAERTPRRTARYLPTEFTGAIVLDEATSVRLSAEFEGHLVARGGGRERAVRYREVRSGIGERPVIPPPPDPPKKHGEGRE